MNSEKRQLNGLQVVVLFGEITKQFIFTIKKTKIGDRQLITFVEDVDFSHTFQFNNHIAIKITNLVERLYQGEIIDFPITVGDFGTSEEALLQQKPFNRELVQK